MTGSKPMPGGSRLICCRRPAPITKSGSTARNGRTRLRRSTPDPLYGERYLPRKFKIGLAIPEDNTIDVLTNDLAIVPLYEGERLAGYDFLLGGGHGMTHNNPKTYPRLATPVAFVEPEDLLEAAAAVVRLHRDHGDRGNRRHARLKYVIAENRRGVGARTALRISRQGT